MAITVGSLTIRRFQELPFGHSGDSITGQTARRWSIKALLTPAEWLTLDGIYTTWRTARLADADTMVSLSIGSTVSTSGTLYGMSWNNVAAWFAAPPSPSGAGNMVSASFELIDATQQLAAMLRGEARNVETRDNESTYGTYTLAGVVLNLTGALYEYRDGPSAELTAAGTHVIKGALTASRVLRIQGWTHTANAGATIRSWYETQVASLPTVGALWPISPPQTEQKPVIVAGARVTRHLVNAELLEIR